MQIDTESSAYLIRQSHRFLFSLFFYFLEFLILRDLGRSVRKAAPISIFKIAS
jgi:hypothetical protein